MMECASPRNCGGGAENSLYKFLKLQVDTLDLKVKRIQEALIVQEEKYGQQLLEMGDSHKKAVSDLESTHRQQYSALREQLVQMGKRQNQKQFREDLAVAKVGLPTLSTEAFEKRLRSLESQAHASDLEAHFVKLEESVEIHLLDLEQKFEERFAGLQHQMSDLHAKEIPSSSAEDIGEDSKNIHIALEEQIAPPEVHAGEQKADRQQDHEVTSAEVQRREVGDMEEDDDATIMLQPSIWDAGMLLFSNELDIWSSIGGAMMIAINFVVQLVFIWIVFEYLGPSNINAGRIGAYIEWRMNAGHNSNLLFDYDSRSLVSRVCSDDASLAVSSHHRETLSTINNYLADSVGPMMCLLAMYVWSLSVITELERIRCLALSVIMVKKEARTRIVRGRWGETRIMRTRLEAWTACRGIWACFLLLVRNGIAIAILFAGNKWISSTFAPGNILLNALGLDFVLNIDDDLFEAMAPRSMKVLIEMQVHLPGPPQYIKNNLWMISPGHALMCCGFISFSYIAWVLPNIDNLHIAKAVLCSGRLDFVVSWPNAYPWLGWSASDPTPPSEFEQIPAGEAWDDMTEYAPSMTKWTDDTIRAIIMQRIHGADSSARYARETHFPELRWSEQALMTFASLTIEEATQLSNPNCVEQSTNLQTNHQLQPIRTQMNMPDLTPACSGKDWIEGCSQSGQFGSFARLVCPHTCNCTRPGSTQVLFDFGCPQRCDMTQTFKDELNSRPCIDLTLASFTQKTETSQVVTVFYRSANASEEKLRDRIYGATYALEKMGCEGIPHISKNFGIDLCQPSIYLPGRINVQFWCPESCQCNRTSTSLPGCPTSCFQF